MIWWSPEKLGGPPHHFIIKTKFIKIFIYVLLILKKKAIVLCLFIRRALNSPLDTFVAAQPTQWPTQPYPFFSLVVSPLFQCPISLL